MKNIDILEKQKSSLRQNKNNIHPTYLQCLENRLNLEQKYNNLSYFTSPVNKYTLGTQLDGARKAEKTVKDKIDNIDKQIEQINSKEQNIRQLIFDE